jgi:hypothetical protein
MASYLKARGNEKGVPSQARLKRALDLSGLGIEAFPMEVTPSPRRKSHRKAPPSRIRSVFSSPPRTVFPTAHARRARGASLRLT